MLGNAYSTARLFPGGEVFNRGAVLPLVPHSAPSYALPAEHGLDEVGLGDVFEHHVAMFRNALLAALAAEPTGAARSIRSYIRAACGTMATMRQHECVATARLMLDPDYREIWGEFIDEVCSPDSIEPATQMACRYALEGLWLDCALCQTQDIHHIDKMQQLLLAMTSH